MLEATFFYNLYFQSFINPAPFQKPICSKELFRPKNFPIIASTALFSWNLPNQTYAYKESLCLWQSLRWS